MLRFVRLAKHSVILIMLMLIIGSISTFDSIKGIDKALQDYIYTINAPTRSDNIYIIGIDNASLEEIGTWGTWSRGVMGELIETLNADPENAPTVIGIDVMYFGNKEEDLEGDEYLSEAAKSAGNVVVANEVIFGKELNDSDSFDYFIVDKIQQPYDHLKNATRQGFINTIPDTVDNKVRKSLHKVTYEGKDYFSFADEVYRLFVEKKRLPLNIVPQLNNINQWDIDFATGDYGGYSLSKVLSGEIPVSEFKDSIVLVGPYSTGMQDEYYTPIDRDKLFGVDIHANIIQCLMDNRFKHEASREAQTVILLLIMIILYVFFNKVNIKISTVIFIVALGTIAALPYLLYRNGTIISVAYPLLAVVLLYTVCLINNYIVEIHRRKKITDNFKKYVAPQVVESLIKGGIQEVKLGGIKREIAVLFVDIRGFTSMAEKLNPEQVVEILNEYLNITSTAIFNYGGMLDKFIGDATMAIFNAPLDLEDYVFKSVCAALEMMKGAEELSGKMLAKFGTKVSFGIGINSGEAVVGNIGATFRMEYTAIGDTVNTAARLESNAESGQILISECVYQVVEGRINAAPLGKMTLKGKSNELFVYQLNGLIDKIIE